MPRGAITKRSSRGLAGGAAGQILISDGTTFVPTTVPPVYFNALAADIAGVAGVSTLATVAFNSVGVHQCKIWCSARVETSAAGQVRFNIVVDGVATGATGLWAPGAGPLNNIIALNWVVAALPAGAHTVLFRANALAGVLFVRPATQPLDEFANIMVEEKVP